MNLKFSQRKPGIFGGFSLKKKKNIVSISPISFRLHPRGPWRTTKTVSCPKKKTPYSDKKKKEAKFEICISCLSISRQYGSRLVETSCISISAEIFFKFLVKTPLNFSNSLSRGKSDIWGHPTVEISIF